MFLQECPGQDGYCKETLKRQQKNANNQKLQIKCNMKHEKHSENEIIKNTKK